MPWQTARPDVTDPLVSTIPPMRNIPNLQPLIAWHAAKIEELGTALNTRLDGGLTTAEAEEIESDMTLLGIVGMIDPPRPEVPAAIRVAQAAGIRVLMITGDAADTAMAVANSIGFSVSSAVTADNWAACLLMK